MRIEDGAVMGDVNLLVDTGADATILPRAAVERLGFALIEAGFWELEAYDGARTRVPLVRLDLVFNRKRYRGRYPVVEQPEGVLGRDIINEVALLLDGPRQQWSVPSP
ncbi:MAG TPA: aspartyl protease family protein [Phycisphaerae bacterium]|nr:aspartyl protease family protein [Phycisphaerae bacterium]